MLLLSVVNNFLLITSFSFNYLVVIIVCIAFESAVIKLDLNPETLFYYIIINLLFFKVGSDSSIVVEQDTGVLKFQGTNPATACTVWRKF